MAEGAEPRDGPPARHARILIPDIRMDADVSGKEVKGQVVHKGPLVTLTDHSVLLKAVIREDAVQQDPSRHLSINIVLFASLAKNFYRCASVGDVVVASGFTVGKSPTALTDRLHPCNLLLAGEGASIQVCRPATSEPPPATPARKRKRSAPGTEVSKVPKYTYKLLDNLQVGDVVNVYGVVVFFKQPFKSRGTDFCSSLKITDQTNQKVSCTIFCAKLEHHPKIFRIGDIVRLHRVKVQRFNDSVMLINSFGFSVVTFDGAAGGAVEPRASGRSFSFDREDQRRVEELRSWASSQALLPAAGVTRLSDIQPRSYFDLTCQLLAKALVDSTCVLLRVWDGTRCPHPLLKVTVEPGAMEGPPVFSAGREKLIADVQVYDNHTELARQLKPGDFLRMYNLRAMAGPGGAEPEPMGLYLHGGTAYGRGIRLLPEDSADVQELKRLLGAHQEEQEVDYDWPDDASMLEVWATPPQSPDWKRKRDRGQVPPLPPADPCTERRCIHSVPQVPLAKLRQSRPPGIHHVRVQLKSYQPRRLFQALKLFCSKCLTLQDVPDDQQVSEIFSEASRASGCSDPPRWAKSVHVPVPDAPDPAQPATLRQGLVIYLSSNLQAMKRTEDLLLLKGASLREMCLISSRYPSVIPVRPTDEGLGLMDLGAPFLFRGRRRFYGCKLCSQAALTEPSIGQDEVIDEKKIAEALGVQLMKYVLLVNLQLQDDSDSLDAFLWRDAGLFFGMSAEDAAANQEAQDHISEVLDLLCPPESDRARRPWLDVCLTSYQTDGEQQTCYQVCHTAICRPWSHDPDNTAVAT